MPLTSVLSFLKFSCKFYGLWPLNGNPGRFGHRAYGFLWWIYFVNCVIAAIVELTTCYHGREDYSVASFTWMELIAIMEDIIILINYKSYKTLLQYLLNTTESYLREGDTRTKLFIEEKAAIFGLMMSLIIFLYFVLVVLYVLEPVVTEWDSLVTTSYYPPWMRSPSTDIFLYFNQIIVILHTSGMVYVDAVVVLLIYVCTVRLKVLAADMRLIRCNLDLKRCIVEHQFASRLAEAINRVVRFVALKTMIAFIGYSVGAGLQVTNPDATVASLQRFSVVLLLNSIRLTMTAVSADGLSSVGEDIKFSLYTTSWYEADKKTKTNKIIIMMRCQKPLKIYVSGLMSGLNLAFITGILASSISYFSTVRLVVTRN